MAQVSGASETVIKFSIAYDTNVGGFMKLFWPVVVSAMRRETKRSIGNLKPMVCSGI